MPTILTIVITIFSYLCALPRHPRYTPRLQIIKAYLLADEGYDVWLGNFRGNNYNRNHTTLDVNSKEFWDFSWQELVEFDLPSMLNYVLQTNGAAKLTYVGHSLGTTTIFALLSMQTEYNDKVKAIMALAPITVPKKWMGPVNFLRPGPILEFLKLLQHGELPMSHNCMTNLFASTVCQIPFINYVCPAYLFSIFGADWSQYNGSHTGVIMKHVPSSTSVKLLEHYQQLAISGKFTKFDYGNLNNKIYNQPSPPEYDLRKVGVSIALFWGDNDWLAGKEDVAATARMLPNVVLNHKVNYTGFSHADFLIAVDAVPLLYKPVLDAIKKYAP